MIKPEEFCYQGTELDIFSLSMNWKHYLKETLSAYIGTLVLEVGAGIGSITKEFCNGSQTRWVSLEPDEFLASRIRSAISYRLLPSCCEVRKQTILEMPVDEKFDTILYIDVLEHIEDDVLELTTAADHLLPLGNLIVISPAHQWLFSPFDKAIGHLRRYTKRDLLRKAPNNLRLISAGYLDSIGLFLSLANRFLLKTENPTERHIRFWDKLVVPFSRRIDPLMNHKMGKSLFVIWTLRNEEG